MTRLKSREKFIPGGFGYYEAVTKWNAPKGSFDTVVRSLIQHRKGNPFLAEKHKWSLDYAAVADEVDAYNARICAAHGWKDYISEAGEQTFMAPKSPPPRPNAVRAAAVGANSIMEMFGKEGPDTLEHATARAKVCAACPLNNKGDLLRFFTVPAATALRAMLGWFKKMRLETPEDANLQICEACYCPTKLKVWCRLSHILKHIPKEDYAALDANCWILREESDAKAQPAVEPKLEGGEGLLPDPAA